MRFKDGKDVLVAGEQSCADQPQGNEGTMLEAPDEQALTTSEPGM